jgi:hypothetical protein
VSGPPGGRAFVWAVRSEWWKVRSLRSTVITLVVAAAGTVGLGAGFCALIRSNYLSGSLSLAQLASFESAFSTLIGLYVTQFAVGLIGVLAVTAENATGLIKVSLVAVPSRLRLLGAKALVLGLVVLATSLPSCVAAFFVGEWVLGLPELHTSIGAPGVLRTVLVAPCYLVLVSLLGLGVGTVVRRTPGAVAAFFALLVGLPIVAGNLPAPWNVDIERYTLFPAALTTLLRPAAQSAYLSWWWSLALVAAYAAGSLLIGGALLRRRDA